MPEFEFSIAAKEGTLTVEGDERSVSFLQPCGDNDPDREPGDIDVIQLTIDEARELLRMLSEAVQSST